MNSPVFVILFWFLVEHFKLSARTKDARDTRDAFLESVYPCIDNKGQNKNFIDGESKNEVEKLKDHIKSMVQGCASFRFLYSYKDATGN